MFDIFTSFDKHGKALTFQVVQVVLAETLRKIDESQVQKKVGL